MNVLIKQGLEKGKIHLDQFETKKLGFDTSFKKREKLLITLPLSLIVVETLVKIKNIDCNLQKVKKPIISVKPHPMTTRDEILNLGWKKLQKMDLGK